MEMNISDSSSESDIEAAFQFSVKKSVTDFSLCVICQKTTDKLLQCTETTKETFLNTVKLRENYENNARLYNDFNELTSNMVLWHQQCYSSYTSKKMCILPKEKEKEQQ